MLSIPLFDLRVRVVAAIEAVASRRQAAKRFGVGAANAIRLHERFLREGRIEPKPMGDDCNLQRLQEKAALRYRTGEEHLQSFLLELHARL